MENNGKKKESVMPSLVDECLLGKNKFKNFLEVVENCGIKTGYDFIHFMSITKEHCVDKGITDYDEIKRIWEEHKDYDKLPDYLYYKDKRYLGNLYANKETYEWLTTPSDEDDDIGDWRENTVFTDKPDPERVKACQDIFEGIDKVTVTLDQPLNSKLQINDMRWFFDIIDEFDLCKEDIKTFVSVIKEHCINKGIYDLESIKNTWKEFKDSLENISEHLKEI